MKIDEKMQQEGSKNDEKSSKNGPWGRKIEENGGQGCLPDATKHEAEKNRGGV